MKRPHQAEENCRPVVEKVIINGTEYLCTSLRSSRYLLPRNPRLKINGRKVRCSAYGFEGSTLDGPPVPLRMFIRFYPEDLSDSLVALLKSDRLNIIIRNFWDFLSPSNPEYRGYGLLESFNDSTQEAVILFSDLTRKHRNT